MLSRPGRPGGIAARSAGVAAADALHEAAVLGAVLERAEAAGSASGAGGDAPAGRGDATRAVAMSEVPIVAGGLC